MKVFLVALIVLLLNIPFGYWRGNVKKFSLQWALAIHVPIPFIIFLRIYSGMGFELYTYPVMILVFFLGQYAGTKIYSKRKLLGLQPVSSCLVMDVVRQSKTSIN